MVRRSGFTLIELLVVLAILAVLAALIFPAFASAREKGRSATCLSNIGQLARASILYANENDDRYANRRWLLQIGLARIIARYPSMTGLDYPDVEPILICPKHRHSLLPWPRDESGGYAYNACLHPHATPDYPANVVLVGESASYEVILHTTGDRVQPNPDYLFQPDVSQAIVTANRVGDTMVGPRDEWGARLHLGRGNYAFVDGHARSIEERTFYVPQYQPCGSVTPRFES